MVVIRLSRGGSKKRPYFNVVVAESSKKRDGRFIERVGFYNPSAREGSEALRLESERIEYWQSNGAQLSETVNRIVKLNAKGPDGNDFTFTTNMLVYFGGILGMYCMGKTQQCNFLFFLCVFLYFVLSLSDDRT